MNTEETSEWQPVCWLEYGEIYEMSEQGTIRRIDNKVELRPVLHKTGYYVVNLSYKGKKRTQYVHRLVALTFIPNPSPEMYTQVGHWDDDPSNNSKINLYWTDAQGNNTHGRHIAEMVATITKKRLAEERKNNARRKPVYQIIPESVSSATVNWYTSIAQASRETNVSTQSIRAACRGIRKDGGGYRWIYAYSEDELKVIMEDPPGSPEDVSETVGN